jgi:hypothetical protein
MLSESFQHGLPSEPSLGVEDAEAAAAAVEPIYPPGYVAPAVAAQAGPGGPNSSPAMNPGADQGEFSSSAMTGPMGGDSQNSYGGGYAGGNPTEGDHPRQSENDAEAENGCGHNAGTDRGDRCVERAHPVGSREHRAGDGLRTRGVGTAGPPRPNALGSVAFRSASAAPSPR